MHRITVTVAAVAGITAAASAQEFFFSGLLLPSSEVPPADSPASGSFQGILDVEDRSFSFSWTIDNLLGVPAAPGAHIHEGGPGINGPIRFFISDAEWETEGEAEWEDLSDEQIDTFIAGGYYLNFHTDQFPGGEVRGQIVPTPGAVAPFLGLGALAARRRR